MQKQMHILWRNKIPMCVEVLVYPNCEHGYAQATAMDPGLPTSNKDCILIEQWIIQAVPRLDKQLLFELHYH